MKTLSAWTSQSMTLLSFLLLVFCRQAFRLSYLFHLHFCLHCPYQDEIHPLHPLQDRWAILEHVPSRACQCLSCLAWNELLL